MTVMMRARMKKTRTHAMMKSRKGIPRISMLTILSNSDVDVVVLEVVSGTVEVLATVLVVFVEVVFVVGLFVVYDHHPRYQ